MSNTAYVYNQLTDNVKQVDVPQGSTVYTFSSPLEAHTGTFPAIVKDKKEDPESQLIAAVDSAEQKRLLTFEHGIRVRQELLQLTIKWVIFALICLFIQLVFGVAFLDKCTRVACPNGAPRELHAQCLFNHGSVDVPMDGKNCADGGVPATFYSCTLDQVIYITDDRCYSMQIVGHSLTVVFAYILPFFLIVCDFAKSFRIE